MGQSSSSLTSRTTSLPSHPTSEGRGPPSTSTSQHHNNIDTSVSQFRDNMEALHNHVMQQAGADYDIVTTTTLSYSQFLTYISRLNDICKLYKDDEGRVLVFAVKKGTDSSIFWKATVKIACVKYHTRSKTTESYRLLNIRQFLKVFRRITYECTDGTVGSPPSPNHAGAVSSTTHENRIIPPTAAASFVLDEIPSTSGVTGEAASSTAEGAVAAELSKTPLDMEECIICLERKPEVILPCAHAYCLPCIQQWWEYSIAGPPWLNECASPLAAIIQSRSADEKTCPICREAVSDDDDTWVISETPDDVQVYSRLETKFNQLKEVFESVFQPQDPHVTHS